MNDHGATSAPRSTQQVSIGAISHGAVQIRPTDPTLSQLSGTCDVLPQASATDEKRR